MEVPDRIVNLYKHWPKHLNENYGVPKPAYHPLDQAYYNELIEFINERQAILEKKLQLQSPPYTNDPILQTYKFCNIFREFDRQTIYFHTLLKPYEDDFEYWLLNMLFCRSISRTETIDTIGLLDRDSTNNKAVYERLTSLLSPKYGDAYIFPISVIQSSEWNTREKLFCLYYPKVVNKLSQKMQSFQGISVNAALGKLLPILGFPLKFLLTEVLIDVAYQYPDKINLFTDFPIGPGSIPTMKRLRPNQAPEMTVLELSRSIHPSLNDLTYEDSPIALSAENWEGIGCEFRKYSNLKQGNGRRRRFRQSAP